VLAAFEKIWGTKELIVSYDTINLTLPNASEMGGSKPWPHVDQAPERKGLACVQGIINRKSQTIPREALKSTILTNEQFPMLVLTMADL
jgi:hypothetical protein